MTALILLVLAIVYYYYFYKKTKDSLNPIGVLLFIWCFTASISALYWLPMQQKWNFEMIFIVIGSSVAVFFSGYITTKRVEKPQMIKEFKISSAYIVLTRIIFIISLICVLIEWRYNGYILPGLQYGMGGGDLKSQYSGMRGIHYGVMLMPYCAIFAFFELLYSKRKLLPLTVIVIAIIFYSYMIMVSRGSILLIILGMLYVMNKKYPMPFRKVFIYGCIVIVLFVLGALARVPDSSLVFQSLADKGTIYMYISPVYTYIAYSFENLFKLVVSDSGPTLFNYSLKAIWDLMGFRDLLNITLYDTLFFNSRTYLYSFYHDLGFIGTIFFPFLIGFFVSKLYQKSYSKPGYILMLAVLQKAIISTFFGNYFFGEFIIMWPYLISAVVVLSLRYEIKL